MSLGKRTTTRGRRAGHLQGAVARRRGLVPLAGRHRRSGNTIVVSHDAGGVKDAYRTIYMHLRNGADKDCDAAWKQFPVAAGLRARRFFSVRDQ